MDSLIGSYNTMEYNLKVKLLFMKHNFGKYIKDRKFMDFI